MNDKDELVLQYNEIPVEHDEESQAREVPDQPEPLMDRWIRWSQSIDL